MDEAVIRELLRLPFVAVASDGSPSMRHPRGHGTFARVLGRSIRNEYPLAVAAAIHRMTALPADLLGLPLRGRLQVGHVADLTVFDPKVVSDPADFLNPFQRAKGFQVYVGGRLAWDGEKAAATRHGRVLRKAHPSL